MLFDATGQGWLIDFDRGRIRVPETRWRARNLARLERSLLKLRGERTEADVRADFARLRAAYDAEGRPTRIGKSGFYLRPAFVARILARASRR